MGGYGKGRVLIVDDEQTALKVLSAILEAEGFHVFQAAGVEHAIEVLDKEVVDTIITDIKMPGKTGLDLFQSVKVHHPDIPVIFLTAYATIDTAINTMVTGAYHYFVKPPDYQKLKRVLASAAELGRHKREKTLLRSRREDEYQSLLMLGDAPEMRRIYDIIETVKNSPSNVLVYGETGTGKELISRALHLSSNRSHRPFVAVNCAAIPRDLIEAELFGHEKGAFTGATQRRVGRIEAAAGGSLFLDEIGELDVSVQSKLLRVLQEKEFSRLGDNRAIEVDFRLIASTNRDLRKEIENGNFREDLFYRLNVVCINVPPLRERKVDIRKLTQAFMDEFCAREGKTLSLNDGVWEVLQVYAWPGNVRELKNVVEGVVVLAKGRKVSVEDLPAEICATAGVRTASGGAIRTLKEIEASTIRDTLERCGGNKSKAAILLGVSRKTLYKRIKEAELH
jgi:two-component system response regulator HydG